ncbi:SDR family NAD(P)-dependent oxidoreductase [Egicoccus halophilus]|uniref:Short-chain dehydrogenase/reductase n=1 Tax=Egicoccus halophilus TaxID=1670830 RepID=A0A8J3AFN7_9ACTN|nr:SDR family NAD(P)-dependent oxidoreductase [Egicoccus halophilus]GGI07554.1 short-chain dehydrogenase/reductase [Egicoccus halophilus]
MRALVTGSNSGFGRAIVGQLADAGMDVVASARRPEAAADLRREREGGRGAVDVAVLDVAVESSREQAIDEVFTRYGAIDVLVNNAGILRVGSLEDMPPKTLEQMFATNFFGPVDLARRLLPQMRARGAGRIVNVTAIGAVLCTPFLGAYCATKHALDSASASMDLEVRSFGVRVCSVLPGAFRTAIAANLSGDAEPPGAYAELVEDFASGLAERIEGGPDDLTPVTRAVLAAATDSAPRSRYLVGGPPHLGPLVDSLEAAHLAEAQRLGLEDGHDVRA